MVRVLTLLSCLDGGGVENILLNYYRNMDREKVHMDIVVIHSPEKGSLEDSFKELGCNIYKVTPMCDSIPKNIAEIHHIMKKGRYHVIHSRMNVKGLGHLVTAWLLGIRVRIIHNHLAYMPLKGKMKYLTPPAKGLSKLFATHWMACSDDAAIEMFGRKAFREGKVTVLKNAIPAKSYEFDPAVRERVRREFGMEDRYVVGMVGRFRDQKNHEYMIRTFKKVVERRPDALLMLVGGGELEEDIRRMVRELKMEENVLFAGVRTDVPDLMQGMDIFALPTKYEGFGNVLIEAQASGLRTLTSAEGVPRSTQITDLIEYISLSDEELWVEKILQYADGYERTSRYEEVKKAGFDIVDQAHVLENIYVSGAL